MVDVKLHVIQIQLKVPKSNYNDFGNFVYRSCENILEALKPLLQEHACVIHLTDSIEQLGDRYYIASTATIIDLETGESRSSKAYAREAESKTGMDAAQITGSASSYARKYALNGLFAIDDIEDPDATSRSRPKEVPTAKKPASKEKQNEAPKQTEKAKSKDSTSSVAPQSSEKSKCVKCSKLVKDNTKTFSLKKYGKILCYECQKGEQTVVGGDSAGKK